jgi:hypothetical protein
VFSVASFNYIYKDGDDVLNIFYISICLPQFEIYHIMMGMLHFRVSFLIYLFLTSLNGYSTCMYIGFLIPSCCYHVCTGVSHTFTLSLYVYGVLYLYTVIIYIEGSLTPLSCHFLCTALHIHVPLSWHHLCIGIHIPLSCCCLCTEFKLLLSMKRVTHTFKLSSYVYRVLGFFTASITA